VSELAVLAPDVEAAQSHEIAEAAGDRATVEAAVAAAVVALRAAAGHHEPAPEAGSGAASDVATLLRGFADQLEQPQAWINVDRVVHELLADLLRDVILADPARAAAVTARTVAVRIIARDAVLWPGAGPRMGCTYNYDGLLATIRRTALAA
jgi:hypothetical protein